MKPRMHCGVRKRDFIQVAGGGHKALTGGKSRFEGKMRNGGRFHCVEFWSGCKGKQ